MAEYRKSMMQGQRMKWIHVLVNGKTIGRIRIDHFEHPINGYKLPGYESKCIIVCTDGSKYQDLGDWQWWVKDIN